MEGITEDIALMKSIGMNIEIIEPQQEETSYQISVGSQDNEEKVYSEDELVAKIAIESGADKLIYLTGRDGVFVDDELIREISVAGAEKLLFVHDAVRGKMREKVKGAILACRNGVSRVHIISGIRKGALLQEIFSCQGMGTMIFEATYQNIRQGKKEDATGIVEILNANDFNLPLSEVSKKIDDFLVFVVDEVVYGCALVEKKYYDKNITVEISYLSTCSDYEEESIEQKLLEHIINKANIEEIASISLEVIKNSVWLGLYPWFLKLGFQKHNLNNLPQRKKSHTAEVWLKAL